VSDKDRRACSARGKRNGEVAGHADFHARILTQNSARMSVSLSVSVSVPWNSTLTGQQHFRSLFCIIASSTSSLFSQFIFLFFFSLFLVFHFLSWKTFFREKDNEGRVEKGKNGVNIRK